MTTPLDFTMPREAFREMVTAGAVFDVRRREDSLGFSFTYRIAAGGDAGRCRKILAAVKARPPMFFEGFKAAVQGAAASSNNRGAV